MIPTLFSLVFPALLFSAAPLPQLMTVGQFFTAPISVAAPSPDLSDFSPVITAPAAAITDAASGTVLWSKGLHEKRAIASLTKLMTALIILENHRLDEIVTVSKEAVRVEGASMSLASGEQLDVASLLKGLLIPSANDAALALAIFHSGSVEDFVTEMNRRAYFLGMNETSFANPHGFDMEGHFSTAFDLSILARKVWSFPFVREVVGTKKTVVTALDGKTAHTLSTTNQLLSSGFPIFGLKTGTTDAAGQCFIALFRQNGRELFITVLNSTDRFYDTKTLLAPFLERES